MKPTIRTIASQPSWVIRTKQVELAVTQLGGHMAPVTFYRGSSSPIRPYYISPWHGEKLKISEPVLVPLRGDFLAFPFGGNAAPYRGERHQVHGETAGAKWRFVSQTKVGKTTTLTLSMRTKVRPGKVTKNLHLVHGQNAVYIQHMLEGYRGAAPVGHHAMLAMPDQPRSVHVSTSPVRFGQTNPGLFSDPATGEYQSLAIGKRFKDLQRVPLIWKDPAWGDCSAFPTRTGFDDLLAVFNKPGPVAWTAAAFENERFLWYSLKDPAVLPATALWISNRGRHGSPWNGRNVCLGLEDVCGYFADGLAASVRANPLRRAGLATAIRLLPGRPTAVNYIQGVVKTPRGFGRVRGAIFKRGKVLFIGAGGRRAVAKVNWEFLKSGEV